MLHEVVRGDEFYDLLSDDPVRPLIPHETRVGPNGLVLALLDEQKDLGAMVCINIRDDVPTEESDLFGPSKEGTVAVFYTIWSYQSGYAGKLIFAAVDYLKANYPNVKRFVTLSPPTEMAKNFHLRNGAVTHSINLTTVNYEYNV